MPFSTDANWPQGLLNIFDVARNQNTSIESRYYGSYDRLFNYAVIEGSFNFFLAPQTSLDETSARDAVDFVVFMVVLNQKQKPVLTAEIRDDRWANGPDKRQRADTQMRQRYDQMLLSCPIPRLYGLSLLGTSLRVCCGDKVTGKGYTSLCRPPQCGSYFATRLLGGGEWNLDILSLDGLATMQDIVADIKSCQKISNTS